MRSRILLALGLLTTGTACNPLSLGRRGLSEILGARGVCKVVRDANPATIAEFSSLGVGSVDTELGALCPPEMTNELTAALRALPPELGDIYTGQEPRLTIQATIVWYQEGGGVRAVLGDDAMCIARTYLLARDDTVVADLRLIAASGAVTRAAAEDLAQALAKALGEYLRNKTPPREQPL